MQPLFTSNLYELEILFERFLEKPDSVDPSFRYFFEGLLFAREEMPSRADFEAALKVRDLIAAYRHMGHVAARSHPLAEPNKEPLAMMRFGFSEKDLERSFPTLGLLEEGEAKLADIVARLEAIYTGSIGYELGKDREARRMLQEEIEKGARKIAPEKKMKILGELNRSSLFESFLHTKYVGQKRFSLEGAETLIPMLLEIIERGAESGLEEVIIGMPHRGRLNVLVNILNKSYAMVFSEFEDYFEPDLMQGSGDVKYHKGFSSDIETASGRMIHLSLIANASHLESVDPIVEGKTYARQRIRGDRDRSRVLALLIHGDAALAGQGVVYETLQMSKLSSYGVGGTLHIVINNLIGFTTTPEEGRSTRYPTDIARTLGAPIFHVNGEDPEAAVYVAGLAYELKSHLQGDVFIDLGCYRKYGHNEGDEPAFTQPLEYRSIRGRPSVRELYRDRLVEEGALAREQVEALEKEFQKELHDELESLNIEKKGYGEERLTGSWSQIEPGSLDDFFKPVETKIDYSRLKELAEKSSRIDPSFEAHPKVRKLFEERLEEVEKAGAAIDWAMGEMLALGSLLSEGTSVRLSGQDSVRGTFSQRHARVVDQKNGASVYPLERLVGADTTLEVINSPLSEYAALGFEFGYSLASPEVLTLWEAQYGDFVNGAQIIIDQYLSVSEQKWNRFSGLVLLLPHGYEGQGPEHSSGRLERFLQLSALDNWEVAIPTTSASYFHILRRQMKRAFRRPLILFTPKSLLRHPKTRSPIQAFTEGRYEMVLDDPEKEALEPPEKVRKVLLCSGKIFYALLEEREKRKERDLAIIRLETLFPLDGKRLMEIYRSYPKATLTWVQEEPLNMGAARYILPRLDELLKRPQAVQVVARGESSSPASGYHRQHVKEERELIDKAFE